MSSRPRRVVPARFARAPDLAVASNRGPVAFVRGADGSLAPRRGVGGLVTAVGGALQGRDAAWVAAAITEGDREVAARDRGSVDVPLGQGIARVRLLALDEDAYDAYYNEFSNRILWFLHHYLWETPTAPSFGPGDAANWNAYRQVNRAFADALAQEAPEGSVAFVQDYHLSLVSPALRGARPDLRIALYWHIPFCQPDQFRMLPDTWARPLLEGMLGADLVGFQTQRWAANFLACCREVLGARVTGRTVRHPSGVTRVGVYPIGVNPAHLEEEASRPEVARELETVERIAGDRFLFLRVDRTELSKNILRGFAAYETLLERRPDLHERVVHLALLTPSRREVPEYQAYTKACAEKAEAINLRFGRPGWQPIALEIEDNFPRTLAAYRRYDALVVNSVYDGMNLVAREGPVLNERQGTVVLSRNAGAAAEMGRAALVVNPFDVAETATALERAVDMSAGERALRGKSLKLLARGTPPDRWLDNQLADVLAP